MKFSAASLRWSNEAWLGLKFNWDENGPAITEALKSFPVRAWDTTNKTWWFPASHANVMVATVQPWFPDLLVPNLKIPVDATARSAQKDDHAKLGVHPEAPDCVVHAAFKALSKELDPNLTVGGLSRTPFEDLESAYLRICRARGLV